jgi:energy-coupling factor transporter ATP-binding protein EcfA2
MKLKKFRVSNFKSISDSGDCYLEEQITLLAGKNEAGKTSLLEALECLTVGKKFEDKSIPIENENLKPVVHAVFEIDAKDIEEICREAEMAEIPEAKFLEVEISKSYPDIYIVGEAFFKALGLSYEPIELSKLQAHFAEVVKVPIVAEMEQRGHKIGIPESEETISVRHTELFDYIAKAKAESFGFDDKIKEDSLEILNQYLSALEIHRKNNLCKKIESKLLSCLPNFILFKSFEDVFPNEIPLQNLQENPWVKDLVCISDLNVSTILGTNERNKRTHKTELNTKLNKDFSKFWSQDLTALNIDWSNEKLFFWIEENGRYYEPEIRSQGRKWHLAFYIRVSARARENVRNVILIDEPGLYLHANAQRDILSKLEQAAEQVQVVFTTHSPYLIEPDKLERVRLILKDNENKTRVENKIHKVSDKEALTPILTAIGTELNKGIISFDKEKNVIVEGVSDYFYLTALSRLFGKTDLHFVFGGGAGNMPKVGTIMMGWGCKVIYLYDNDQAFNDATKNIRKEWVHLTADVLKKLPVNGSIENIFSKEDFAKYAVEIDVNNIEGTNAEFVEGQDKVLKSRRFLENSNKISKNMLTEETVRNSDNLFEIIEKSF